MSTTDIVGREEELAALAGLVRNTDRFPRAVLVEGEAGIGKTTLWREAVAAARDSSRVLVSRPSAAEAQLSFTGLRDLLSGVAEEALADLPEPQRRALEVALVLDDPGKTAPDQGAIALAFLGSLRTLAESRPLVVGIDDVQWLDEPSAAVLEFAARRIDDEPIAFLLSQRTPNGASPLGLGRSALEDGTERIRVGPLSLGAVQELLHRRLGTIFSRPILHRIHEQSGGNPFYALELARALDAADAAPAAGQPLPIPDSLDELVRERLARLPAQSTRPLLVVASLSDPTVEVVEAALKEDPESSLGPAFEAGVLELEGDRMRFTHPLLASVLYESAGSALRREVHKNLVGVAPSSEERARHLALSTREGELDPQTISVLDEAARVACARGAPSAAADLLDHVLRLDSSNDEASVRRALRAAELHFESGNTTRAEAVLASVLEGARGRDRAEVLWRLARVRGEVASPRTAVALLEDALQAASGDHWLEASIHCDLALMSIYAADARSGVRHARAAVAAAELTGKPGLMAEALAARIIAEFTAGVPLDAERLDRALELERAAPRIRLDRSPSLALAFVLLRSGKLDAARARYQELYRRARERGDESSAAAPDLYLGVLELAAGNWELVDERLRRAVDVSEQTDVKRLELAYLRASLDAYRGRVEGAREAAEAGLRAVEEADEQLFVIRYLALLGFIELGCGDAAAAEGRLRRAVSLAREAGIVEAGLLPFIPDTVEALVRLGKLGQAERLLRDFERGARLVGREPALAAADRCRGLLYAASKDLGRAEAAVARACERMERLPLPFEHARTLLALGHVQRRAKRRRPARVSLEQALAIFEELGAEAWAEKARDELARIGGRAPSGDELTPSESRIAALVAEGKTNKEVAAELYVTVHTVEQALTRVYRKLGIRSRTELARKFAAKV